jgi:ferredoxin
MSTKVVNKTDLDEILTRLMQHYRIFAPVRQENLTSFQQIYAANQIDINFVNSDLPPKSLMLPQSESMFTFTLAKDSDQTGILQEVEKDLFPRVIFSIRPCDAKSFQLLDLNFDTASYQDPWWVGRRQSATLVGLGCNDPCSTCFCTSVGSGPFASDGLDLLLTDVGDQFTIETITERGDQLLKKAGIETESDEAATEATLLRQQKAHQTIKSVVYVDNLKKNSVEALFNADFWDRVQFSCINCGVCTFSCPTCWCFDIQDEVRKNDGVRLRNWDGCMFPLFTLHGSGHNPRGQKLQRVRQRFMHKLKYFLDKYDQGVACVGCGRCVQQCPVNIDIREVFRLMNDLRG